MRKTLNLHFPDCLQHLNIICRKSVSHHPVASLNCVHISHLTALCMFTVQHFKTIFTFTCYKLSSKDRL